MREERRVGRPRSVSRATLEEAACELFLEQGYAATSVADITRRAGVSRATFFNYIPTKSDLLWTSVDDALDTLATRLTPPPTTRLTTPPTSAEIPDLGEKGPQKGPERGASAEIGYLGGEGGGERGVRGVLLELADGLEPGTVVLAFANAEPMGVAEELEDSAARRQRRAAQLIGGHLRRHGHGELEAEVRGAALAGAFLAALRAWARAGPGETSLADVLRRALAVIP